LEPEIDHSVILRALGGLSQNEFHQRSHLLCSPSLVGSEALFGEKLSGADRPQVAVRRAIGRRHNVLVLEQDGVEELVRAVRKLHVMVHDEIFGRRGGGDDNARDGSQAQEH
jgi:hypothetical protein